MKFTSIALALIAGASQVSGFAFVPSTTASSPTVLSAKISGVMAREILDSRGNPTVEVDMTLDTGATFRASVPSGASTGAYEAVELRDGGDRYLGKGVLQAIKNVNDVLGPKVIGMDPTDQKGIDDVMLALDGTPNKANMGANAILGVSLAASKAGAAAKGVPLYKHFADLAGNTQDKFTMPVPCFNVINGGSHAGNKLAFQEYFVIPTGAETFSEAMKIGCEVYHTLGKIIKGKFGGDATLIGDEGGFAPPCDIREGCELIMEAIKKAGYDGKCTIGLDVAASEFKVKGEDAYDLDFKYDGNKVSGEGLGNLYQELSKDFPIVTVEDPFDEDDWSNWSKFTAKNGEDFQVVGDDLTVTNIEKISRAVNEKACTCLLLKVNQIGSISESIAAVKMAKEAGWGVMTSHRSGETEDTYIADIAVGLCTGQIKTGAPCRSERLAKYNQLLRIEAELGAENCDYAGANFRTTSWMGDKVAATIDKYDNDEEEYYDDNFDLWGESSSSDTSTSSSSIADSTLSDIANDYHFPIDYLAHAVCSWGADPPIDVEDRLGDLVNGEQCFALLEAVTTLDPAEVDEAFAAQNVAELAKAWGAEPGVVFEACVREGLELPFGIRTRLKEEDVDGVQRWVRGGSS